MSHQEQGLDLQKKSYENSYDYLNFFISLSEVYPIRSYFVKIKIS